MERCNFRVGAARRNFFKEYGTYGCTCGRLSKIGIRRLQVHLSLGLRSITSLNKYYVCVWSKTFLCSPIGVSGRLLSKHSSSTPINILYCHYNLGKADCFLPRIYGEAKFRIWSQKIVKAPTLPLRHYYWSAWLSFLSKVRGTVLLSQLERDEFKGRRRSRFNPTPTAISTKKELSGEIFSHERQK